MKKKRELTALLLSAVLLLGGLLAAGWALKPEENVLGIRWRSYRQEPKNSIDVIFVGSSLVFCDIIPAEIYADCGVTSYLAAAPSQVMAASYYSIREACRTQAPKAIFLELSGLFFSLQEEFSVENAVMLPWGVNRLGASLHAVPPDRRGDALLPVLAFHDRWSSLTVGELKEKCRREIDLSAGFEYYGEAEPQRKFSYRQYEAVYANDCFPYLEKTAAFCRERGIALYLYLAPTMSRIPPEVMAMLERDLAALPVAEYLNFNEEGAFAALRLDPERDWLDDQHLNAAGAKKFSACLADILRGRGFMPTDNEDEALWRRRVAESRRAA